MKPVALLLLAGAALAVAKPTVYFIRHGEKPSDDDDQTLSAKGKMRAQCLRKVFGAGSQYNIGHIMAQTPGDGKKRRRLASQPPVKLYAVNEVLTAAYGADGSRQRPYDTVAPLAGDLGIPVDTSCDRDDSDCVSDAVEDYRGSGNILIWYGPLAAAMSAPGR